MNEHFSQRASEIIKKIKYVTIATVTPDGHPWNSPVYAAYDTDLNFYWFSDKDSRHSTNVRASGEAFLVIYDSTVPEGTGEGVYLQVSVRELSGEAEVMAAKAVCDQRVGKSKDRDITPYTGNAPIRAYKATPVKIWMNSDAKNPDGSYLKDIRAELDLTALKAILS